MSSDRKLIFGQRSAKLVFENLKDNLVFGQRSAKLVFDVVQTKLGYPYTYPMLLS